MKKALTVLLAVLLVASVTLTFAACSPCARGSHKWDTDNAVVTTEPTCEQTGVKTLVCLTCGNRRTETIPAIGHDYGDLHEAVEPQGSTDGNVAHYQCSVCDKYFDEEFNEIDAADVVVPADPSNPGDNTDPSNPGDNTDPSNPGDNTDPSNPGDNTDPSNPGDNTDPSNPGDNTDPSNPGDNTDPSNPGDNTDPSNPGSQSYALTIEIDSTQGRVVAENGSALASTYEKDTVVTFKVIAEDGYEVSEVKVNGATVTATDGVYTLTVTGNMTITVTLTSTGTTDPTPQPPVDPTPSTPQSESIVLLTFGSDFKASDGNQSSYTNSWTATRENFNFTLENFNNNNYTGGWTYVKAGATASIDTDATMLPYVVTSVVADITVSTESKFTSFQLIVSTSDSFEPDEIVETISGTLATGEVVFEIENPATNYYYRLKIVATETKVVSVNSVDYIGYDPDACAHDWNVDTSKGDQGWTWDVADGQGTASLAIKCENCDEERTLTADADYEETLAPKCNAKGTGKYSATVTQGSDSWSATHEVTLDEVAHSYDTVLFDEDAEGHYHKCTVCGTMQESAKTPHSYEDYDVSGDHHEALCEDCGYVLEEAHNAYWFAKNLGDEGHQQTCSKCGATNGSVVGHEYDQPDNKCVCGAVNGHTEHTYNENKWNSDGTHHWRVCDNDDFEDTDNKQLHVSAWTDLGGGNHKEYCTVCQKVIQATEAHSAVWESIDDDTHHKVCEYCDAEVLQATAHVYLASATGVDVTEYYDADDSDLHIAVCTECGEELLHESKFVSVNGYNHALICEVAGCHVEITGLIGEHDYSGDGGACTLCGAKQSPAVWEQATDESQFKVGDRIVIASGTVAMGAQAGSGSNNYRQQVSNGIVTTNGKISIADGVVVIILEKGYADDSFALRIDGTNTYLYYNSGNYIQTGTANNSNSYAWRITNNTTDNKFDIENVGTSGRLLQYNSNNTRFSCYTGTQQAVEIYRLVSGVIGYVCDHEWEIDEANGGWTWNATATSATATLALKCGKCDDVRTETATVTHVDTFDPTDCTADATRKYTATVALDGQDFSDDYDDVTIAGKAHTSGAWFNEDASGHYHKCTVCNLMIEDAATPHSYTTYTDQSNGKHAADCSTCGFHLEEEHQWAEDLTNLGDGNHARLCEANGCVAYTDHAGHSFESGTCECGAEEGHVHNFTSGIYMPIPDNPTQHAQKCVDDDALDTDHPINCTATWQAIAEGTKHHEICSGCGREMSAAADHTYALQSSYSSSSLGTHTAKCDACQAQTTHGNSYEIVDDGHKITCALGCSFAVTENHDYDSGDDGCICGAEEPKATPKTVELTSSLVTSTYSDGSKSVDGITFEWKQLIVQSSSIQFKKSEGMLWNKTALGSRIVSIEITYNTVPSNVPYITFGTTEQPTGDKQNLSANGTYTPAADNCTYFKITAGSNAAQIKSIKITYLEGGTTGGGSTGGGTTDPTDPNPTPGGDEQWETETITASGVATSKGWSSNTDLSTITVGDITLTFAKASGTSTPAYNNSNKDLRLYAKNTLTISVSGDKTIKSIKFTCNGATYNLELTANTGTYTKGSSTESSWSGSANSVTFTAPASGQHRMTEIEVAYE